MFGLQTFSGRNVNEELQMHSILNCKLLHIRSATHQDKLRGLAEP